MKNLVKKGFIFVFMATVLFACKKEKESPDNTPTVDVRDASVGSYGFNTTLKMVSPTGDLIDFAPTPMPGMDLSVRKSATGIEFLENDTVILSGTNVQAQTGGYSFEIASQKYPVTGIDVEVKGYVYPEIGGKKYQGVYTIEKKSFNFALQTVIPSGTGETMTLVILCEGARK